MRFHSRPLATIGKDLPSTLVPCERDAVCGVVRFFHSHEHAPSESHKQLHHGTVIRRALAEQQGYPMGC